RQEVCAKKTRTEMKWRGPRLRAKNADAAIGRHEPEHPLPLDQVIDAYGSKEVHQIGAATHADVLAGTDEPAACCILERACPATQAVGSLENRDFESCLTE